MTKVELVDLIAEEVELSKKEIEEVLEAFIRSVQLTLKTGDKVSVGGLGTFVLKERPARLARNPKTGERVQVSAKKSPKFRPGKELKEAVQ